MVLAFCSGASNLLSVPSRLPDPPPESLRPKLSRATPHAIRVAADRNGIPQRNPCPRAATSHVLNPRPPLPRGGRDTVSQTEDQGTPRAPSTQPWAAQGLGLIFRSILDSHSPYTVPHLDPLCSLLPCGPLRQPFLAGALAGNKSALTRAREACFIHLLASVLLLSPVRTGLRKQSQDRGIRTEVRPTEWCG